MISRLLVTLWKWWLWRSTQRMAGDIISDYMLDMSYQVVWNLVQLSFSKHADMMIQYRQWWFDLDDAKARNFIPFQKRKIITLGTLMFSRRHSLVNCTL